VSMRLVYEAYSIARAVEVSCGSTPSLREALALLEEYLASPVEEALLEEAAELLRAAEAEAREAGCLEWYLLGQAADTLEHVG